MSEPFDPYQKWLGIPRNRQPADHYRLLGLEQFEADLDAIEHAADRQMAHVRSFQQGPHAETSQRILNELAAARLTLIDAKRKAAYDRQLRAKLSRNRQEANVATPAAAPVPAAARMPAAAAPAPVRPGAASPPQIQATESTLASQRRRRSSPAALVLFLVVIGLVATVAATAWFLLQAPDRQIADRQPPSPPQVTKTHPQPQSKSDATNSVAKTAERPMANPPGTKETPTTEPAPSTPSPTPPSLNPPAQVPTPPEPEESPEPEANTPPKRIPLPDEASQADVLSEIKDVFGERYTKARNAFAKSELARALVKQADQDGEPVTRYVLLREAQRLATEAGDARTAIDTAKQIAVAYDVDTYRYRFDNLMALSKSVRLPDPSRILVEAALERFDNALIQKDYDAAAGLSRIASSAARRARDRGLTRQAADSSAQIGFVKKELPKFQEALERAEREPENSEAQQTIGQFYCLAAGNWLAGLPHLANGTDADLKALAERELSAPDQASEQLRLANGWWDLSEKRRGPTRRQLRFHAAVWYRRALRGLDGLSKTKAAARLAEMEQEYQLTRELLPSIDPAKHAIAGTWRHGSAGLRASGSSLGRLVLPELPGDNYNLQVEFTKSTGTYCGFLILPVGPSQVTLVLGAHPKVSGLHVVDGKDVRGNSTTVVGQAWENGRRYVVNVQVRTQGDQALIAITLDGQNFIEFRGNVKSLTLSSNYSLPDPKQLALGVYGSVVDFHSVKLRRFGSE